MDWVSRMNEAIRYIEDHITEEIDYSEAAKIACCSTYHFQRMFSFITDVALSEYIRRRRLTLAAFELQSGPVKVIDLALKYGYDSPEAFTRAFQSMHGTTPTAARSAGTKLKAYPPMTFQLSIKGAAEMNYRMEEAGPFAVVGVRNRVNTEMAFDIVPKLWAEAAENGLFGKLWDIRDESRKVRGILGVCAGGDFGKSEEFDYILAITSEQSPPEGMAKLDFPAAAWAVFEAPGSPDNLQDIWRRLYTEWVPVSAYDLANLPAIECYLPIEENKNELWVPVVKRK
ncbi:AraC family transcriptional regulator [Cohnella thailandensis]|uniref:AraC family transcriptional regulator n=1 Tax=Cohnella thailandensis TaxID=557557 RepID=A0A841SSQ9_9BACL|nr:AraC family transcriptional regulator [Cohnella thailandensis]MBB6634252.1 AraC family transcriptional regulator [Cohnella thailandensis]MBP1972250.1 AraC family transcriptional regulator [Cohnella thailandensis]